MIYSVLKRSKGDSFPIIHIKDLGNDAIPIPSTFPIMPSKVTQVVVDEMDTMLTQGFSPDIDKLTRPMLTNPERRESTQFVFVTATLTKAVRKLLDEGKYPKVCRCCKGRYSFNSTVTCFGITTSTSRTKHF